MTPDTDSWYLLAPLSPHRYGWGGAKFAPVEALHVAIGPLASKVLIPQRQYRFALIMTRPPLLSSATRHLVSGSPVEAKLASANARPPFGMPPTG